MMSVEEEWKYYESMVVPKEAGEIQRQCTKEAFYAGFGRVLSLLCEVQDWEEEDITNLLNGWKDEVIQFAERQKELLEKLAREQEKRSLRPRPFPGGM